MIVTFISLFVLLKSSNKVTENEASIFCLFCCDSIILFLALENGIYPKVSQAVGELLMTKGFVIVVSTNSYSMSSISLLQYELQVESVVHYLPCIKISNSREQIMLLIPQT